MVRQSAYSFIWPLTMLFNEMLLIQNFPIYIVSFLRFWYEVCLYFTPFLKTISSFSHTCVRLVFKSGLRWRAYDRWIRMGVEKWTFFTNFDEVAKLYTQSIRWRFFFIWRIPNDFNFKEQCNFSAAWVIQMGAFAYDVRCFWAFLTYLPTLIRYFTT